MLCIPTTGPFIEIFCISNCEYVHIGFRRIYSGGITRSPCSEDRFQPFRYTTYGNYECVYLKSFCTEVGQVVFDNGSTISDRRCACDHSKNYTFMNQPHHFCYCEPDKEDCSCIIKTCPDQYIIDPGLLKLVLMLKLSCIK